MQKQFQGKKLQLRDDLQKPIFSLLLRTNVTGPKSIQLCDPIKKKNLALN